MKFKRLEIEDKKIFDTYFGRFPQIIAEFTFTNLFAWRKTKHYEFIFLEDYLVIRYKEDNTIKYFQPVGKDPVKTIKKLIKEYPNASFERVEKSVAEKTGLKLLEQENFHDYVYKIQDLVDLKGNKYEPKRNFIKQALRNDPEVCDLNEDSVKCFLKMQCKWCNIRNCEKNPGLLAEALAVKETVTNFEKLGVIGVCIRVNDSLEAFAIGEPLNEDTFVEHFEKANPDIKGLYQYVLHEFVKRIPKKFQYLNRESDLGISGLKKAKQSYYPSHTIEKFKVS